jgi:hypothetical protein
VYNTLRYADPVDKAVAFRFPTTLRRHYQKLTRFPEGLLVTGDAVTCFNPVYAGGMSVAALCAITMRSHLHSGAAPVPQDYFHDIAKHAIDAPWEMTTTVDLSFPGVEGDRPFKVRFGNWFLKKVQVAATRDGNITEQYFRAAGLIDPPSALQRPGFFFKVLFKSLLGPSKESREPFVYTPPAGVEPWTEEPAGPAEKKDLPRAA